MEGELPKKALRLVEDWIELNRQELMENWKTGKLPKRIFLS